MAFSVSTKAFGNGGEIPVRYTCSGADESPALTWSGVPSGTKSLALIADDPDAPRGTWTHWVAWNIPVEPAELLEDQPLAARLDDGMRQGHNDFGRLGYGGPCPPPGKPHRYFFRLFAVDSVLELGAGTGAQELRRALEGHVLAQAEYMGTFHR